jgi:hypothetical protein
MIALGALEDASSQPNSYMHNQLFHAKDRGCTKPGCDVPAYLSQVHHVRGWKATRRTDINELTLSCGPDNRLVEKRGFTTRKNIHGDTEWIPFITRINSSHPTRRRTRLTSESPGVP